MLRDPLDALRDVVPKGGLDAGPQKSDYWPTGCSSALTGRMRLSQQALPQIHCLMSTALEYWTVTAGEE